MSGENCLVCASDEGVFLDIVEQPTLRTKAKNCRLEKVSEDGPSTKVCHKCAFEIDQCNTFVEKIKKAGKIQHSKKVCVLCSDAHNKDIFFDLSKQKFGVHDFVQQIRDLFTEELRDKQLQKELICLSCRYCADLLTDLRNLSDEVPAKLKTIIKNGINPADLPKTKTSIVSRKTTFIQSSNLDLNTPSDTDSESSSIMSSRRKENKTNKSPVTKSERKCEQCKTQAKSGIDMYRIYRTGITVCKECWLTIDPGKTPSKKRKKFNYSETKLCSVLLKDVYKVDSNNEHEYKIEKDNQGNTMFIVTDDSGNESKVKRKTNKAKSIIVEDRKTECKEVEEGEGEEKEKEIEETKKAKITKGDKKEETEKSVEVIQVKSTRPSGRRRKESEQSTQEETEIKSTKGGRRKESEQSLQEEIEVKSTRASRRRRESEQSLQEEVEIKPTRSGKTRRESEQSVQDNLEAKPTRAARKRKESEQSIPEEVEVQSTRSTRSRKDSEQSVKESIETKSTRASRRRKESEQSIEETEVKSTRSNRNRKDSEQSVQESIEGKRTRGARRRKESEQSVQEDVEINVDIDSDSGPILKKTKKSNAKTESMPKQILKSKVSNQSSASEVTPTRKRGRSSSIESTSSSRKSIRNAKKNNVQELEEIIEIEDDSDSSKLQKENVSMNEDIVSDPKRSRTDKPVECDDHSDVESNASELKVHSKRSSSLSSKESSPAPEFKAPTKKVNHETTNSETVKDTDKETKIKTKTSRLRKSDTKPDDSESLKSIEVDTSESEEIDILKSTDEETKEDTLETEVEEKDISKSLASDEIISKPEADDLKCNKDAVEEAADEEIAKSVDENSHVENEFIAEMENEIIEESLKSLAEKNKQYEDEKSSKLEPEDKSKLEEENTTETVDEKCSEDCKEKSIEKDASVAETSDVEKDTVVEAVDNAIKDVALSDIDVIEKSVAEGDDDDQNISDSTKENKGTSSKRSSLNSSNSRKSKSLGSKKSKKGGKNKKSADDIAVYDSSDSEVTKTVHEQVDTTYTCTICDKIYESKYIGLQHELTHMKTLEIKLEKVQVPVANQTLKELDADLEVGSKEESLHSNDMNVNENEEKMEIDTAEQETENEIKDHKVSEENNHLDAAEKDPPIDDNELEMKESSCENIDVDISEAEKEQDKTHSETNEVEESTEQIKTAAETEKVIEKDAEEAKSVEENDQTEQESETETASRRSSRRSSRKIDEKHDKKSRGRRKTDNAEPEEENSAATEADTDKIAEAVQETLNDMAELHGKIQESTSMEEVPELNETTQSTEDQNENEIETVESTVNETNENKIETTETSEEKDEATGVVEVKDIESEEALPNNDKIVECETIDDNEVECEVTTPVVDVEDEVSKEVVDVESEAAKRAEESEVEITEITAIEAEALESTNAECEQVDLTQNDECNLSRPDDDVEIEAVTDSNKNIQEDENTVDSVTEINVTSADEPCVENNDENPGRPHDAAEANNDDEDNNTEDEEALAQESLEDLLQRKGLQIIDEFAESVTDGDEESEKDANVSLEKENCQDKEAEVEGELEIKISDAECTEILEISSKSIDKQKEVEVRVVGESQITQDVDVVEEVVHDDDQPHSEVVQEVEVESNGNCLDVANNVVGEVLTKDFNAATVDVQKRLDLQTEPISDDETDILPETLENISREIRNSQDMPSLDPICEVIGDE